LTIEPRIGTGLPAMHPGELLREEILPALGRPRVEIARLLGVSRQALHAVLAERAAVTPDMALRLGKLCGNGPELWLALQTRFDLERLRREKAAEIDAIPTLQGGVTEQHRRGEAGQPTSADTAPRFPATHCGRLRGAL
jgi:addiction module HigA family antidote